MVHWAGFVVWCWDIIGSHVVIIILTDTLTECKGIMFE